VRRYSRGLVAANPDDASRTLRLAGSFRLVVPHGGGELGASATTDGWGLGTRAVSGSVTLAPHSGAILLR